MRLFKFYILFKTNEFQNSLGITSSNEKNGKAINAKLTRYFSSICPYYLLNRVK